MAVNVFFLRVSSASQHLESQFDELWNYYSSVDNLNRDAIKIIEYKESGVRLSEEDRLGITELKKIVESQGVDTVYVSELSRLARTEKVLWSLIEYLETNRIQLKCLNPSFTLLNDERSDIEFNSRLMVSTFGTLATQEAIEKRRRFARGKARKAKEGKYNGGAIPYGYKIDANQDNLIVIDEEGEGKIVREIFNLYEGGMSQKQIAKEMYERGVSSRAVRTTKRFTISLVHQILTNRLLTGHPSKGKQASYERVYPMIITPEQFERCRKIAEGNNTKIAKSKRVYYAHSLIECTQCRRKFTGTGSKGYYHCWDAHFSYRDLNGMADTPRCTNRLCISTNVMDSLLWEISKDYEANFILSSSKQCLIDCQRAKSVLEEKIKAIGVRRQQVEERMDNLLEAFAEGMKKERFLARKAVILEEQKEIDADEASFKSQLLKYESLIAEMTNKEVVNFDTDEGIDAFLDDCDDVWDRVSSITDDNERSRIIHKFIEKVTVEATTINYKFNKYPTGKDVVAKRITIYTYMTTSPSVYYFVPNNGKGGVMLKEHSDGGQTINLGCGDVLIPQYSEFPMEYLPRITDNGKKRRRAREKAERERLKNAEIEQLRAEGYISMNDMMIDSKLSYSTLYKAIKSEKMVGKNACNTWFVKKKDYKVYLKQYASRSRLSKSDVIPTEA